MKITAALAAAIVGVAALTSASIAQAQGRTPAAPAAAAQQGGAAAGTLPNSFGDAPAVRSVAAPAPGPASASTPETVEAAKTALRTAILALQSGTPDYDAMTSDLAEKIREQSAQLIPLLQGFGEVQAGVHAGSRDGVETFGVAFERAATEWRIALNAEGKIAVLLFRPAPAAPASEPAPGTGDPEADAPAADDTSPEI